MKLRDAAATTVVARSDRVWVVKLSNERYFDNTSSLRLARRFSSRDDRPVGSHRLDSGRTRQAETGTRLVATRGRRTRLCVLRLSNLLS